MRRSLLVIMTCMTVTIHGYSQSQSGCAQTLRLAQSVYDQGRLQELPELLKSCLSSGFTTQEKVSAYKLLTLTYIYMEEPEKADENMLNLLRTDNEFTPNDGVDPAEFIALYRTFRTNPIYRIGGKAGVIATQPNVVSADYVNDGNSRYKRGFGLYTAISAEIPLSGKLDRFTFNPEISFQLRSFSSVSDQADSVLVTNSSERAAIISIPVLLQYKILEQQNRFEIYASAGAAFDYMLFSNQTLLSSRGDEASPVEEKTFDVGSQRQRINTGVIVAAGYKRKVGKGFLQAELRYQMGLLPWLTKEDQYKNEAVNIDYKFIDAIYKANTLSISIGYIINRYNPKKLTAR